MQNLKLKKMYQFKLVAIILIITFRGRIIRIKLKGIIRIMLLEIVKEIIIISIIN